MGFIEIPLLTIGHSTHPLEFFMELLLRHEVSAVADVRSAPYSRYCPQFNKDELARSLQAHGIRYVFLGRELGARADDVSCYANGRVQYARLAQRPAFQQGIARLKSGARDLRITIMCAEREPLECHRTLLVARALDAEGIAVEHILPDGSLERHEDAMERLLTVVGLPREDLFRSRDDLVAEALVRQEDRIAYKDENFAGDETGEVP